MLVMRMEAGRRADLSAWRVHGMQATATGTVDFSGLGLRDGARSPCRASHSAFGSHAEPRQTQIDAGRQFIWYLIR